jgi:beta-glucosidase
MLVIMLDSRDLVANLPVSDRIRLLSGRDFWTTQPVGALVPSVMMTDGPHGLRKQSGATDHAGLGSSEAATCFPTGAALASSWDPVLLAEVGAAIGAEARAAGVSLVLGPGLNLKRHPCGGRNFEYFSEDPYLSGTLAAAMVRGIQSQGVGACPKHFAANNQETARMLLDTIVDERTLREIYLRAFEIVVRQSAPAAIMTSYNLVNGQYACEHEHLLRDILRGEWGFEGLVVSDWGGTNDRVAALRAGLDLEMPGGANAFDRQIAARAELQYIDEAATRVVAFAKKYAPAPRPADFDAHHLLARRAAVQGAVLLSNDGLLPLPDQGSCALIGAFAEQPRYQGAGSSQVNPTRVDTLRRALPEAVYAPGYDPGSGATSQALLADAVHKAAVADRVVLVVGLPELVESEAIDRRDLSLPQGMTDLIETVLAANERTVVVVMAGAPVDLPWADRAGAVLYAYLGGQAGGAALADVLTGRAEPGGRLAETFPMRLQDLPAHANFPGCQRQVQYRETFHVGYRSGVPARFAFGHGLGYTTFDYTNLAAGPDRVSLDLRNTGGRAGSHVVQVYLSKPDSVVPRPPLELAGFAKAHLTAGQSARLEIPLVLPEVWQDGWRLEAGRYEVLVGASSVDLRLRASIVVESPDVLTDQPPLDPVASEEQFASLLGGTPPAPPARRPFTRNSTLTDLREHRLGRIVAAAAVAGINRTMPDGDSEIRDAFLAGMPLRGFVLLTGGKVGFALLDLLLAVLNARPGAALRRLAARS